MPNYREVAMSLKNPARGAAGFPDIFPLGFLLPFHVHCLKKY
jgi:hypothetical protein